MSVFWYESYSLLLFSFALNLFIWNGFYFVEGCGVFLSYLKSFVGTRWGYKWVKTLTRAPGLFTHMLGWLDWAQGSSRVARMQAPLSDVWAERAAFCSQSPYQVRGKHFWRSQAWRPVPSRKPVPGLALAVAWGPLRVFRPILLRWTSTGNIEGKALRGRFAFPSSKALRLFLISSECAVITTTLNFSPAQGRLWSLTCLLRLLLVSQHFQSFQRLLFPLHFGSCPIKALIPSILSIWTLKVRVKKLALNTRFKKLRSWHSVPSLHGK